MEAFPQIFYYADGGYFYTYDPFWEKSLETIRDFAIFKYKERLFEPTPLNRFLF